MKITVEEQKGEYFWSGELIKDQGRVVKFNGHEKQWFYNEKDANAWVVHLTEVSPWDARKLGFTVEPWNNRGVQAGDCVVHDGTFGSWGDMTKGFGIIDGIIGKDITDEAMVTWKYSSFRDKSHVSTSGGPGLRVPVTNLVLVGLREVSFWQWQDTFADAHNGGHYTMTVPLWRWKKEGTPANEVSSS